MAEMIHITLPDGSQREVPKGTTPLDIAKSISPRLADAALAAKIKQSAASPQPSTSEQNGGKAPASMHAAPSKDGWQFADL
ncbi:MAG TPA: TGS domain-containing protein, partial [Pyrinomonadaceae bacterium]|nr:TGS domain-containing protein [Pyrinomonadaceae bacterium]